MATASQVPHTYDVVINGEGYLLADSEEQRAAFGYSPTFVPRTDVTGDYGDWKQDFWMTWTQRDWSLGEQQRYARPNDEESARRYWIGTHANIQKSGQVSARTALNAVIFNAAVVTDFAYKNFSFYAAGATNLLSSNGSIDTDHGAHGAGATPSLYGVASDDTNLFITGPLCTSIRKMDGAGTFTTFSADEAFSLAFLNNTLYGYRSGSNGDLVRYDTAGALTSLYTWREADGTAIGVDTRLIPLGGRLIIIRAGAGLAPTLWLYDGTAPSLVARLEGLRFPLLGQQFSISAAVVQGTLFISGLTDENLVPSIRFYANGTVGELWRAESALNEPVPLAEYASGLAFVDPTSEKLMFYNPASGGISSMADLGAGSWTALAGNNSQIIAAQPDGFGSGSTAGKGLGGTDTVSATATVTSSLVDFDSSLNKLFRAIRVDWDDDATDTGATVDIAYRVNDLDGAYTTLQAGAVSGTEYLLTNISGRSISVKVTLNKSGSTYGPTLKRVAVRAVPVGQGFKRRTYMLKLAGRDGQGHLKRRNDETHDKDGLAMLTDLQTAATSTNPISITDWTGTFTGIIRAEEMDVIAIGREEFLARIPVREV